MGGVYTGRCLFIMLPGQGRGWDDSWSSESRSSEMAFMFVPSIVSRSSNFSLFPVLLTCLVLARVDTWKDQDLTLTPPWLSVEDKGHGF